MSLFALSWFELCEGGLSTGKQKIYTIDGSKYGAKNECNTLGTPPKWQKYPSSGANRPSDSAVTVNINAEYHLMTANRIIECWSRDFVPEYCHCAESSVVYTAPRSFVKSLNGCSNRSVPCLPLHMHADEIIPTF